MARKSGVHPLHGQLPLQDLRRASSMIISSLFCDKISYSHKFKTKRQKIANKEITGIHIVSKDGIKLLMFRTLGIFRKQ